MITFDGINKRIIVSGTTSVSMLNVYSDAKRWEAQQSSMIYSSPLDAVGKEVIKPGVKYTDIIYRLVNGWKFQASGYSAGQTIAVEGTLITDDSSSRWIPATIGEQAAWEFNANTDATVVNIATGSGLSTAQNDKLMSLGSLSEEDILKISQTKVVVDAVSEKVDRTENLLLVR